MTEIEEAGTRARKVYPRSPGFRRAYVEGARAAIKGDPKTFCPYRDEQANTWRRTYRLAWLRGWLSAAREGGMDE